MKLKTLILGGTQFIGRNLVESLLNDDRYNITLYNRQRTQSHLFPEVAKIKGDRELLQYEAVFQQDWDLIIDFSAYFPNSLEHQVEGLKGKVGRYIFVSTVSVYEWDQLLSIPVHEELPMLTCSPQQREDAANDTYGRRKAECERILVNAEWLDKIILRPGMVYGPYDPTDRFYYWLYRVQHQLPLLLPDDGQCFMTFTYVKDFVRIIQEAMHMPSHNKTYNATTHAPITHRALVETMAKSLNKELAVQYAPSEQMLKQGLQPAVDIPLWFNGTVRIPNDKLCNDFQTSLTDFADSLKPTIDHYQTLNWAIPKVGRSNFNFPE